MNLIEKVKAWAQGDPDAAAKAGITDSDFTASAPPTIDPSIKRELEEIKAQNASLVEANEAQNDMNLRAASLAFEDEMIRGKHAHAASRGKIAPNYFRAIKADGAKFGADGKVIEGEQAKEVRASWESNPAHRLDVDDIPNADPTRQNAVGSKLETAPTPEEVQKNLALTGLGKRALALKMEKN